MRPTTSRTRRWIMASGQSVGAGFAWLAFAMTAVVAWGLYGILLHSGQAAMAGPVNGRYKAFLFVGVAYFFTAILAPLGWLAARGGTSWTFPATGMLWSLLARVAGAGRGPRGPRSPPAPPAAPGACAVLPPSAPRGTPPVVMSIVFAGAPVVNAVVALLLQPPPGGLRAI